MFNHYTFLYFNRGSEQQLTTIRSTLFKQINVSNILYPQRTYTALCDVNKPTFAPAYGEFDTVGIVASIGNEPYVCLRLNYTFAYQLH